MDIHKTHSARSHLDSFIKTLKFVYDSEKENPLPDLPILGSSNSAANNHMNSKILTNGDTII